MLFVFVAKSVYKAIESHLPRSDCMLMYIHIIKQVTLTLANINIACDMMSQIYDFSKMFENCHLRFLIT